MAKRILIRSVPASRRCRRCGGKVERETTVKGGTTTVTWRCSACNAVFPGRRKAV